MGLNVRFFNNIKSHQFNIWIVVQNWNERKKQLSVAQVGMGQAAVSFAKATQDHGKSNWKDKNWIESDVIPFQWTESSIKPLAGDELTSIMHQWLKWWWPNWILGDDHGCGDYPPSLLLSITNLSDPSFSACCFISNSNGLPFGGSRLIRRLHFGPKRQHAIHHRSLKQFLCLRSPHSPHSTKC